MLKDRSPIKDVDLFRSSAKKEANIQSQSSSSKYNTLDEKSRKKAMQVMFSQESDQYISLRRN